MGAICVQQECNVDLRHIMNKCPLVKTNYKRCVCVSWRNSAHCKKYMHCNHWQVKVFSALQYSIYGIIIVRLPCCLTLKLKRLFHCCHQQSCMSPASIWCRAKWKQADGCDNECSQKCIMNRSKLNSEFNTKKYLLSYCCCLGCNWQAQATWGHRWVMLKLDSLHCLDSCNILI